MKYPTDSPKKAGAWLYDKGANVLSLEGKSPDPLPWSDWQDRRQSLDEVEQFPWHRDGVGVICGISGYRCLDLDGIEGQGVKEGEVLKILDALGFPHRYPWVVESGSGEGYHIWFRCEDDERFDARTDFDPRREGAFDHLELRWENHQTAVPPTVHPATGREYEFYRRRPEKAPWEVSPSDVETAIQVVAEPKRSSTTSDTGSFDVPETISEGERNNALTSLAGTLRNRGLSAEEMEQMLQTVNENRCSPSLPSDEVRKIAQSVERYQPSDPVANGTPKKHSASSQSDPWTQIRAAYESDNKKQARTQAANQLVEELGIVTQEESGRLYAYDDEQCIHVDGGEQAIERRLVEELGRHHSRHEQKEVKAKAQALTYQKSFGDVELIPVANGDLDVTTMKLKDTTSDRVFFSRSPAKWDPDADCPYFKGHLQGVVPAERERETLQEYVGYCLLHWDIPFHKALFVVGPTASGKSTTLHVVRQLLGNVSSVSPQQLVNGRFGPIELEGAWANIRSDISAALLKDIGLFKELVGGDPIYVERKFEQGYTMRPTAKHLYSANRLPDVSIDDDAFYRRILLVSFPQTIPKEDRVNRTDLEEQLESELDGILRWAVEGLRRVLDNNGFTHDLAPADARRKWEEHSSSIGRFKASVLQVTGDSQDVEAKQDVYTAYTEFCQQQGLSTETQQELTRTLKRDPRITDAKRTPTGWDTQTRCYVGVQVRDNTDAGANLDSEGSAAF